MPPIPEPGPRQDDKDMRLTLKEAGATAEDLQPKPYDWSTEPSNSRLQTSENVPADNTYEHQEVRTSNVYDQDTNSGGNTSPKAEPPVEGMHVERPYDWSKEGVYDQDTNLGGGNQKPKPIDSQPATVTDINDYRAKRNSDDNKPTPPNGDGGQRLSA